MSDKELPEAIRGLGMLDTASDGERMIVRVLGRQVGTSNGWTHVDGWCLMTPNFEPDDGFEALGMAVPAEPVHLALMIDFYTGVLLFYGNVKETNHPQDWQLLGTRGLAMGEKS
jgi:hypothetical protein